MNEALLLGERICIMDTGKIIQVDTPEAIQKHPKNNFVGQFSNNLHQNWRTIVALT